MKGIDLALLATEGAIVTIHNILTNPDTSRSCEKDENAVQSIVVLPTYNLLTLLQPACTDDNCHGENGTCTHPVNSGCICWDWDIPTPPVPYDELFITQQLAILALSQGGTPTVWKMNFLKFFVAFLNILYLSSYALLAHPTGALFTPSLLSTLKTLYNWAMLTTPVSSGTT